MTEDLPTSSFTPSSNNYFLPNSRSISYAVEEEDPWSSVTFEPVDEIRQPFNQSQNISDSLVSDGLAASNVLVGVDVPEIFDTAYIRASPIGDRVSVEAVETIVSLGGLGPKITEQIVALTVPSGAMYITRNEFNCAMALLGFAQKNMELPTTSLPGLEYVSIKRANPLFTVSLKPKRHQTFDDDPWRIPSNSPTMNGDGLVAAYTSISSGITNKNEKTLAVMDASNASTESYQWFLDLDQITVSVAEKEGFLFTHINYWVQSMQRQTSVRRRYSDFYWFWETLLKRYPFRVIPNLPPKKMSNKDKIFLERRIQGLTRFINHIVRHPVLKNDEEVIIFLTEQSDFAAWRKAKLPDLREDFERLHPQTEELEGFIPKDLDERIKQVKERLPKTIEKYDALCSIMENMIHLKEARAKKMKQYKDNLRELSDIEHVCFVTDCNACKKVVQAYDSVGTYIDQKSTIMEAEAATSALGVLEKLKSHREICASFLEMLDRKAQLELNTINALYRRISANTAKVNQNRGVPSLEAEVARLDDAIKADTEKMIYQQRRNTYIRYCVANELSYLHKQQAFVAILYQSFVHEQLQYARRSVETWKALEALLCEMPKPEEFA
ncbi:hypothetical protein BDF20DRAFT_812860 [Mycotypha africana]|uniref:uncharacterized protein n=1 Tax=Mycotypha africana TaxID=64632 RepID=UPI0022FFF4E2|nr:uncharacterized protein BDF20DRAFT_812860 [Mycotypha africana]KAI8992008.1 hypothetical protein BDF20DRAFT_812860 [Mycotypha africana]